MNKVFERVVVAALSAAITTFIIELIISRK